MPSTQEPISWRCRHCEQRFDLHPDSSRSAISCPHCTRTFPVVWDDFQGDSAGDPSGPMFGLVLQGTYIFAFIGFLWLIAAVAGALDGQPLIPWIK
ncbi:MAG: hypothetical protein R3F11_09065 [Verrucomicrobiales bacterium]